MKRTELTKRIGREARRQGVEWKAVEGAKHDAYWLGSIKIPIPGTRRSGNALPQDILHECEPELGKGWWRK